jgi:SOS response regulatory protein OraA/RecX
MYKISYESKKSSLCIYVENELWREGSIAILSRKPHLPDICSSLEELSKIYTDLEYKGAKICAYKRLAAQNQCSSDLLKYLMAKLVSEETAKKIVEELQKLGYVDDPAWIESFIRQQQQRKMSRRAIAYKLKAKGFLQDQMESLLQKYVGEDSEIKMIISLINKRYLSKDLTDYHQKGKVIAALLRKGFTLQPILEALEQTRDQDGARERMD